jgi:hypothetical protein
MPVHRGRICRWRCWQWPAQAGGVLVTVSTPKAVQIADGPLSDWFLSWPQLR